MGLSRYFLFDFVDKCSYHHFHTWPQGSVVWSVKLFGLAILEKAAIPEAKKQAEHRGLHWYTKWFLTLH